MVGFGEAEHWTAADGARLALRREPARGARRASAVFLHGFGDHGGRYAELARWLADRGVSVFALDMRGHGRSPGPRGHVARFAQYLSDIVALRRLVAAEAPGPQLLVGGSYGGLVTLRFLETAPPDLAGAILAVPCVQLAMNVPRWKSTLALALADVLPGIPIPTGLDLATLSRDPGVVEDFRSDPLTHHVMTPRCYRETVAAQVQLLAERDRIAVPLLFLLAGDDRVVSTPAARAFAAGLPGDVTLRVYDGLFHDIFHEPARDRVFADLGPWLDRVLATKG